MKNRYFPQYFRASRPYFSRALVRDAIAAGQRGGHKAASDVLFKAVLEATTKAGVAPQRLLERNFLALELGAAQTLAQLVMDGTPLYDLAPELTEALTHSDTGDMRLDDARTLNRGYYLHWGPQPDLLLHGKHPVEGAIVLCSHPDWRIVLVTRSGQSWLLPTERDFFILRFPAATLSLPFSQAVDLAIEEDKRTLELVRQPSAAAVSLESQRDAAIEFAVRELDLNAPVLKKALALVGNSMAYLTAFPDDSRFDWEPDTPASMLVKLQRGDKERQRTASKLEAMGYVQVHHVGLEFQKGVERVRSTPSDAGGTVRPHWRRGHWRHQAYGEKLSLRKLIWLRPTRVLGGLPPELQPPEAKENPPAAPAGSESRH